MALASGFGSWGETISVHLVAQVECIVRLGTYCLRNYAKDIRS